MLLLIIGVILLILFFVALITAWALGWFLWVLLIVGIILIMIRLFRRKS